MGHRGTQEGDHLKDVSAKLVELKKKVSAFTKEQLKKDEEAAEGEEDDTGKKGGVNTTKRDTKGNARRDGHDKKALARSVEAGDHDMATDRMYYGDDGELNHLSH